MSLVRHGHYEPTPQGGQLTALGRRQARAAAKRLGIEPIDALFCSSLSRARETAEIIASTCDVELASPRDYLVESWPTGVPGYHVPLAKRKAGKARIATLAKRHFIPSKRNHHEVVVCHGNLIRAAVSAALDVPLTRWARMFIHHASISRIAILDDGRVALWCYNDTGHLKGDLKSME